MEITINIDGKDVAFKSTGAIPKRYKMQFGRDLFADLFKMGITKEMKEDDIRKLDFDVFYDIAWTFAKTADSSIPEPLKWLDSFDVFPIMDLVPQLQELIALTISSKKK